MHVMARRSQAICHSFFTVRRVTRVAARRSTALVLMRTLSTQSRLSEVPRLAVSSLPCSVAMLGWLCEVSLRMRFPCLSVISRRGRFGVSMPYLQGAILFDAPQCDRIPPGWGVFPLGYAP